MGTMLDHEKRKEPRFAVDMLLNKYVEGRPYLCRATNLSRRGLMLERVIEPRSNQRQISLQFQLPGSKRVITCAGEIVYGSDASSTHGVAFFGVNPDQQRTIDTYVSQFA